MPTSLPQPSMTRALSRGVRGLRREGRWGSTLFMLCAVMTLLQALVAGVVVLRGVNDMLLAKSGISVEVIRGASDRDVQNLYAAIKELPYVETVKYVPKEKALEREQARNPELVESLKRFSVSNPFPDAFGIVLYSLDSYDELMAFLGETRWNAAVDSSSMSSVAAQREEVETYLAVSNTVTSLGYLFLVAGIVALGVIILDIAYQRAYERRDEILLERVLGASSSQTLLPFAAEVGVMLVASLLVGAAVTAGLLYAAQFAFPELLYGSLFEEARMTIVPLLIASLPLIVLGEMLMLPLLGFLSGLLGMRGKFVFRHS